MALTACEVQISASHRWVGAVMSAAIRSIAAWLEMVWVMPIRLQLSWSNQRRCQA